MKCECWKLVRHLQGRSLEIHGAVSDVLHKKAAMYRLSCLALLRLYIDSDLKCAVCGSGNWRSLNLDHDHATKVVRGFLCSFCNVAIGLAGDDPDRLRALALYVEKSRIDLSIRVRAGDPVVRLKKKNRKNSC